MSRCARSVWSGCRSTIPQRTLTALIGGPKKILPRQKLNIPVQVKGLSAGEDAYVTLAAVDEGILQLTEFKSPDPVSYYFGKRRLGVEMRDDYGRLIKAEKGAVGAMREGGDMFGGRSLAVVPTKTVALFSGLVKVGAGGMVNVPLDVPDFNGELRLMAVAFSANKLGHADRPLTVRDPVVAEIVLPRFLAPGDQALAALNLNNVEGRPGNYVATVTASGPVGLGGRRSADASSRRISNVGQRVLVPVEVDGKGLGIANVALKLTGPGGFAVTHSWPIEVRAPQLDIARDETVPFAAGASFTANKALIADLVPGHADGGPHRFGGARLSATCRACSNGSTNIPMAASNRPPAAPCRCLFFNDLAGSGGTADATRRCTTASSRRSMPCSTCRTSPAISACGDRAPTPIRGSAPLRSTS